MGLAITLISQQLCTNNDTMIRFYQRGSSTSYASAGIATVEMCVCLVTLRYCIKMKKLTSWFLYRRRARRHYSLQISDLEIHRGHPSKNDLWDWCTNWRFSSFKPQYLRNGARLDQSCYLSLIGSRICAFDWYQNQRHWMTLNWPWMSIMCSVSLHICLYGAFHKNLNEDTSVLSGAKM